MRIIPKLLQEYCNLIIVNGYENSFEAFDKWQAKRLKGGEE